MSIKEVGKKLVETVCGHHLQHKLRRAYLVRQILQNRHFREPEMELVPRLIGKGDVAVDIGANVGVYTSEMSLAVGASGRVYSFEPIRESYDILTTVVRKARLDNVSSLQLALGSKATQWEMVIPEMAAFRGYYWAHQAQPEDKGRRETVKVVTLDEFLTAIPRVDFVKCDVEGAELQVILGAKKTIHEQTPAWLMEVSPETSTELFTLFRESGYRAFTLKGTLVETLEYRHGISNYFFLHPNSRSWSRVLSAKTSVE